MCSNCKSRCAPMANRLIEVGQKNWELTRYHQPQDDMDQPGLDGDAAAKYARFVFLCGWLITEDSQRPTWNKGDFFGEHYAHAAN
jgi:hypothetical protein